MPFLTAIADRYHQPNLKIAHNYARVGARADTVARPSLRSNFDYFPRAGLNVPSVAYLLRQRPPVLLSPRHGRAFAICKAHTPVSVTEPPPQLAFMTQIMIKLAQNSRQSLTAYDTNVAIVASTMTTMTQYVASLTHCTIKAPKAARIVTVTDAVAGIRSKIMVSSRSVMVGHTESGLRPANFCITTLAQLF